MIEPAKRVRRALIEARYQLGARWRRSVGITAVRRDTPVVVTLTSYGVRLRSVHLTIESLLSQRSKPDRIILWQSQNLDELPESLRRLLLRGLEIRQVPDLGPVTKILYALRDHAESLLVTADDDLIYPRNWLGALLDTHRHHPDVIVCHRAHLMAWHSPGRLDTYSNWAYGAPGVRGPSLMLFPTGVSGVLYPPGSLHADVLDVDLNQLICRKNDDIWLKAMSLRTGTLCMKVADNSRDFYVVRGNPGSRPVASECRRSE